ncbi:PRC-barrel domain-containing protein [Novosphingobium sp. SG707]|uniref:PRC-barrel domain-containing protein n=1 Tax=Novosphingobium sp. SG707 TaxID=2586996 RepID=UPI0017972719|nr:PRC-barrel domain-containing protein [Novosphingobium sp. SG707]NKJ02047.1 hypothetical protein [Novosphingobium sp. SG707]
MGHDWAGWIAPAATMIAAVMTALNLGARVTGWGFVVFLIGSLAWSWIGLSSGQSNLLATNGFLALINALGIWRWLGRQSAYEEGSRRAQDASCRATTPTLFAATQIAGTKVTDCDGAMLGTMIEALISCAQGRISYVVVASGGLGGVNEKLRAVPSEEFHFSVEGGRLRHDRFWFEALPVLDGEEWPIEPPRPDDQ